MTATMIPTRVDWPTLTDGTWTGPAGRELASRARTSLQDLVADFDNALSSAYWSFLLQAEIEDALDTALFRAALADTPTLSGTGIIGLR